MERKEKLKNQVDNAQAYLKFEDEHECPICKHAIAPVFVAGDLDCEERASIMSYCRNCSSAFITTYEIVKDTEPNRSTVNQRTYIATKKLLSEPNSVGAEYKDAEIKNVSSEFVEIYNQALNAEEKGLGKIAGLGYRKTLEFLVKDYVISNNPEDEEKIKKMPLGSCISTYIQDPKIKTLSQKSSWIGNDEAHYERKHEDRDVEDMKKFIKALVFYIEMSLITDDAESVEKK